MKLIPQNEISMMQLTHLNNDGRLNKVFQAAHLAHQFKDIARELVDASNEVLSAHQQTHKDANTLLIKAIAKKTIAIEKLEKLLAEIE